MFLDSINLTNFRNYSKADFTFSPQTTLVVGPNAAGKTNLLEAVYFLATGKSFRAGYDRETIKNGEAFAGIKGLKGIREGNDDGLEITILANENGENTSSKRFKVNGVKKRMSDFVGNLRAVYFGPEEILLVTGSPSRRRKYLDAVLCQVDREYARALAEYEKVLRQRNRLLLLLREQGDRGNQGELDIWDEKMLTLGSVLTEKRKEMLTDFNSWLRDSGLFLLFEPRSWSNKKEFREREIAAGMTLRGPHRDDFCFMRIDANNLRNKSFGIANKRESEGRDLAVYGSRGEQRLAVLHLKLAELEFISGRVGPPASSREASRAGERPILLLDDIFSELDENNRGRVLSLLGKQQTIITATDDGVLNSKHEIRNTKQARMIKIQITKTGGVSNI
jgi:DNA replication and repair protein RecF